MNQITFDLFSNHNCCGVFDLGSFCEEQQMFSQLFRKNEKPKFKTVAAQLQQFEENFITCLLEDVNEDSDYDGGYIIQATLVPSKNKTQRKLHEYFLTTGWDIITTFTNRNTGNKINLYQRYISKEEIEMYVSCNDDVKEEVDDYY